MVKFLLTLLLLGSAGAGRLNDVVDYYETIHCEVSELAPGASDVASSWKMPQTRVKRSVEWPQTDWAAAIEQSNAGSRPLRVQFTAFNRSFDLRFSRIDVNEVLAPDFEVVDASGRRQATRDDWNAVFVRGVNVHDGSPASGLIDDLGRFRGSVASHDGEYHVEPRVSFFPDSSPLASVIYRTELPQGAHPRRTKRSTGSFCGLSDPSLRETLDHLSIPKHPLNSSATTPGATHVSHAIAASWASELARNDAWTRYRRSADSRVRRLEKRVCHLSVTTDVYFWDMARKRSDIRDDGHARSEIALLVGYLIAEVKRIYEATSFAAYKDKLYDEEHALEYSYTGVTFRLQRLKVLTERSACPNGWQFSGGPASTAAVTGSNVHCTQNVDVATLLSAFSESEKERSGVCLAYLFTARDFSGTLGMAYVARAADGRNGVCSAALNTGLISFKNYGALQTSAMSALTLAHELGHNFGAEHDEDSIACAPGLKGNAGGNFIMFYSASADGTAVNNRLFSPCSRDAIARVLNHLVTSPTAGNCLEKDDSAFCGNEQLEDGEECDCGAWTECVDKCCWPADTEPTVLRCRLRRNGTASLRPAQAGAPLGGAVCSPQQGACCSQDCGLKSRGHGCAGESHCAAASFCDGFNATCPRGKPKPNGIPCSVDPTAVRPFSKSCFEGECRRSICHAMENLTECQLEIAESERRKPRNPEQYCFVACAVKPREADGVLEDCVSSYEWYIAGRDTVRLQELAARYPLMHALLVREANTSGIQLPPGSPCSNGRGYCDVFRKCRVIDVDGPLKHLQKLLFSTESLFRFASWLLSNWWYALFMLVGTVIAMGFFIKYCSKHTRSSNPEFTRAIRAANMRERLTHRVTTAYQTLRSRVTRTPRDTHGAGGAQRNRPRPAAPPPPQQPQAQRRAHRDDPAARRRNGDRRSQPPSTSGSHTDSQRDVTVLLDSSSNSARPVSLIVAPIGDSSALPYGVVYTAPASIVQNPLAHAALTRASPPPTYAEVERERAVPQLQSAGSSTSGIAAPPKPKAPTPRPKSPPRIGPTALLPSSAAQNLPPHGRGKRGGAPSQTQKTSARK